MSNTNNKLEALFLRLEEVRHNLTLKYLLESTGFFALQNLYEEAAATQGDVQQTLDSHIGGFLTLLNELVSQKGLARTKVNRHIRQTFTV